MVLVELSINSGAEVDDNYRVDAELNDNYDIVRQYLYKHFTF